MSAAFLLLGAGLALTPSPDAAAVFERDRERLSQPGVHEADGYWFSVACRATVDRIPTAAQVDWARTEALQAINRERIVRALKADPRDGKAVTQALLHFAESVPSNADAPSMVIRLPLPDRDDASCVALAVPVPSAPDAERIRAEVIDGLRKRSQQRSATPVQAMLLLELEAAPASPDVRDALLECLDRNFGDGIGATIERRWCTRAGAPLADGLSLWNARARFETLSAELAERGEEIREGMLRAQDLADADPARWPRMSPDERLRTLGHRAGDARLVELVRADLRAAGWNRTADLLPESGTGAALPQPGPDSRLSERARAALLAGDTTLAMLLSDGRGCVPLADAPDRSASYEAARVAFNQATPEGLNEAVRLLSLRLRAAGGRCADDASLLAASLLALGEPALAAPVASSTLRCVPRHPYAGANLLLALRAMDRRDAARELLARLESDGNPDPWVRAQVAAVRAWLGP